MKYIVIIFSVFILSLSVQAQIEKVIVETYYVSDTNDATDTTGGRLPVGSTTYRIFIDLKKGSQLLKIYGNKNHPMRFESDSTFYKYTNREIKIPSKDYLSYANFKNGTIALDSWLTLGQVTKSFGKVAYFGVQKKYDSRGSIIGGTHNDGGSAHISSGLLSNSNNQMGVALTTADGLDTSSMLPIFLTKIGFNTFLTLSDSVNIPLKKFKSYSCNLSVSQPGISGLDSNLNEVLIGQFTTNGSFSFEFNALISKNYNKYDTVTYVAVDKGNSWEHFSPYLKYPFKKGCMNTNYLEYRDYYGDNDSLSCITPVVFGCMDPQACNYSTKANREIKAYNVLFGDTISMLCCYPGFCNDRDLSIVCPALSSKALVYIYPNPASKKVTIKLDAVNRKKVSYSITNSSGAVIVPTKDLGTISQEYFEEIDISTFELGLFHCQITIGDETQTYNFVKQ